MMINTKIIPLITGSLFVLAGILLLAWTAIGHQYRYSIDEQTRTWHDILEEYRLERSDQDTFSLDLYEQYPFGC